MVFVQLDLDAQRLKNAVAHPVGMQVGALDLDLTTGSRSQSQIGRRLDMVVADVVRGAVQGRYTFDAKLVGANAADFGAHGVEHMG